MSPAKEIADSRTIKINLHQMHTLTTSPSSHKKLVRVKRVRVES